MGTFNFKYSIRGLEDKADNLSQGLNYPYGNIRNDWLRFELLLLYSMLMISSSYVLHCKNYK